MQRRKLKGDRGVYKCHTIGTLQHSKEYHMARSALGRLEYVPRRDEVTGKLHKKLKNRLVNVPIQATGVDLFKLASGLLYREFCKPEYADLISCCLCMILYCWNVLQIEQRSAQIW